MADSQNPVFTDGSIEGDGTVVNPLSAPGLTSGVLRALGNTQGGAAIPLTDGDDVQVVTTLNNLVIPGSGSQMLAMFGSVNIDTMTDSVTDVTLTLEFNAQPVATAIWQRGDTTGVTILSMNVFGVIAVSGGLAGALSLHVTVNGADVESIASNVLGLVIPPQPS